MKYEATRILMSASDLANHLACRHVTALDLRAAHGEIERIYRNDPGVDVLKERGRRHENAYLDHLRSKGLRVLEEETGFTEQQRLQRIVDAMRRGVDVIPQAELMVGQWRGRADVLLRVETRSKLGAWSYEVVDTKLAKETRGGTILQLCLYSELVAKIQGVMPECTHVVKPGQAFQPETYRLQEYLAYYRLVKSRLENEIESGQIPYTYPEPVDHCEICSWWTRCNDQRRKDDHLSFVAGISKMQIGELREWGAGTLEQLAGLPLPLEQKPERGSVDTYERVREQARLQLQYRTTGVPVYELLDKLTTETQRAQRPDTEKEIVEPAYGLARLPEPSPGDIFLDFESDPFVEPDGREYLLGYITLDGAGDPVYRRSWALNAVEERHAFESFIDMVMKQLKEFPGLHIYHFTHYEPTALKRLMGRYASREDEMDSLLRSRVFVDLHGVVRQALRASVEKYSLKDLEVFFGFQRKTELRDARFALRSLECALELNDTENIPAEITQVVEGYNSEDCISTWKLRDWLESLRQQCIDSGKQIARPQVESGEPSEEVKATRLRALALMERLLQGIPADESQHTPEQHAKWLLAHMLEFHRREDKSGWWEYFRLCSLTVEELMDERAAVSGLQFVKRIGGTPVRKIDRYKFPEQETDVRTGDTLKIANDDFGEVVEIDTRNRTIDVKKKGDMADVHPRAVFVHNMIRAKELAESLYRIGSWVADHAMAAEGLYQAARDLLLLKRPRLKSANDSAGTAARPTILDCSMADYRKLVLQLDCGVLPVQGPPGAGKTYVGARMICELLRAGKKVGITAVSHKVIGKLLDETIQAAKVEGVAVHAIRKVGEKTEDTASIVETADNNAVLEALESGDANVGAGTAWLWSRENFVEAVDVLFVDEAGQMCLPDVIAVSQCAKSVVLLGDPQQLEQPLQGTHPPGVAVSALHHILGEHKTMPPDRGIFLEQTWRMAPAICEFTSELFYESRLHPQQQLAQQKLIGSTSFAGAGLWFVPVEHEGNRNMSPEETEEVASIVRHLIDAGVSWVDCKGETRPLTLNDILIVAPYNAQVFRLSARIPGARIGTVDKFQGQEAPVVIYSMTTSSPEEAPRGMEFLYSLNRFNVATSRARCACILVANPLLLEPDCKTPRQMKLANALCSYRERASHRATE